MKSSTRFAFALVDRAFTSPNELKSLEMDLLTIIIFFWLINLISFLCLRLILQRLKFVITSIFYDSGVGCFKTRPNLKFKVLTLFPRDRLISKSIILSSTEVPTKGLRTVLHI